MRRELIVATDPAEAAAELFLELRPRTVVLAGGRTPRQLYERLAGLAYPWHETDVFFGDERCVPADHPDSNFRTANEALLSKLGLSTGARVHRMRGEECGAARYEEELTAVFGPGLPRFDLVLLGLGADGHTASLFPGDPALDERKARVVRVVRPDHPRLTLTLPVLSAARVALFLVAGADKAPALRDLLAGADIPAARVMAGHTIVVADATAASLTAGAAA